MKRLQAFCECLPILFLGWLWGLYDWEYIDDKTLGYWKRRFKLIIKNKDFIL